MTCVAFQQLLVMRVAQLKPCPVMVEAALGRLPVTLYVTNRTVLAQRVLVFVVFFVATVAVLGRFLEHRALVAILALYFGVFAQQGKACCLVVKLG